MSSKVPSPLGEAVPFSGHFAPFDQRLSQSVLRARLLSLVSEAVASSTLTLVSAPAGTGKTVLLSNWVALGCAPGALTWLTTRSADDGTRAFWRRVDHELRASGVRGDASAAAGPDGALRGWLEALGRDLVSRAVSQAAPVVLVVDEGSHPGGQELHRELDWLLEASGDGLRLVLLTRSDPLLPLHRYRLARTLSEIRIEDLRFEQDEALALFLKAGVDASEAQVAALVDRTHGWATGLALAASALAGRSDLVEAIAEFTRSDRAVSDFLAREVLDAQPSNLREVMLRTCICDELPIGLFEASAARPTAVRSSPS
jgi:LuxR family maltose regulon positive regulatory protein